MKHILLISAGLILAACSPAVSTPVAEAKTDGMTAVTAVVKAAETAPVAVEAAQAEVKTKAVLVYAEWCGSCKVLDPKVEAIKAMGAMPGLEFVTLDYTSKDADAFYAQASEAGVETAITAYLDGTIKTGLLLLVDMDDQTVIGKVTKNDDEAEIVTALKDAIAAS